MSKKKTIPGIEAWAQTIRPDTGVKLKFSSNLCQSSLSKLFTGDDSIDKFPPKLVGKIAHIEATYLLNERECSFELFAPIQAVSRDIAGNVVLVFDCPLAPEHNYHRPQGKLLYVRYPGQLMHHDWQAVVDDGSIVFIKNLTVL